MQPPGTHRLSFLNISNKLLGTVVKVFHFTTFSKHRFIQFRLCSLLAVQEESRSASYSERQHAFTPQVTLKGQSAQGSQVPNELFIGPERDEADNYYTMAAKEINTPYSYIQISLRVLKTLT